MFAMMRWVRFTLVFIAFLPVHFLCRLLEGATKSVARANDRLVDELMRNDPRSLKESDEQCDE